MYFIEIAAIVFFGLVLGSFSTALIYRIPRKLPWGNERSSCTGCKANLGVLDLVPVISWCISKGQCRHCHSKISCKYPLIELASVALCLSVYFIFGMKLEAFFIIAAMPLLLSLFVIDLEHLILPNQLVLMLAGLGVGRLVYFYASGISLDDIFATYIMAGFIYGFISWFLGSVLTRVLKKDSLGFGDVKFFLVSGLWLGLNALPYFMIISGALAILFAFFWRIITKKEVFPFGPALIMSLYILLLFPVSFFS